MNCEKLAKELEVKDVTGEAGSLSLRSSSGFTSLILSLGPRVSRSW
jgi:hypothetical protein